MTPLVHMHYTTQGRSLSYKRIQPQNSTQLTCIHTRFMMDIVSNTVSFMGGLRSDRWPQQSMMVCAVHAHVHKHGTLYFNLTESLEAKMDFD